MLYIIIGRGLRRLASWVSWPVGVLSALGLLWVPLGTLLHGYALFVVLSRKGRNIRTEEYRDIVQRTPDIKYRTSWLILALLVIIVVGIVAAIAILAFVEH